VCLPGYVLCKSDLHAHFYYIPESAFLRADGFIARISSIRFFTASLFGLFFERDFFLLPNAPGRFAMLLLLVNNAGSQVQSLLYSLRTESIWGC